MYKQQSLAYSTCVFWSPVEYRIAFFILVFLCGALKGELYEVFLERKVIVFLDSIYRYENAYQLVSIQSPTIWNFSGRA